MEDLKQLGLEQLEIFLKAAAKKSLLPAIKSAIEKTETKIDDAFYAVVEKELETQLLKIIDKVDGKEG